ncbi:MAG: PotD/PotF family extracellular solute-binding protein [Candidatus Velamenicoccus archaeovorus]
MVDRDVSRWMERPLTRRGFLRGAGKGALAFPGMGALLAACSSSGASSSTSASPTALPPLAHELTVAQWPLYLDRAKGGHRPTLEAFEAEYDIDVTYREIINDNQEFFAKLAPQLQAGQSTGWDLIALSDWVVTRLNRGGWIEPLHVDHLPNVEANLLPAFRDPAYDPGNAHSVPWQGGITGIAYNPTQTGFPVTRFADLWDERLAGHVGMLTEMVDTMSLTLLMLGVDPQQATLDDAERAQQKLLEQRDAGIVRKYFGQDYIDAIVDGDTWATMAWSGDVFYWKYVNGADLEFVVPEEGGMLWVTPLEIPRAAEHPTDAHAFMDWYYRPDIAVQVTDWVLYMTPVKGVQELMAQKAEQAKDGATRRYYETLSQSPMLFPPDDLASANLHEYKALSEDEYQRYAELFAQVMEG